MMATNHQPIAQAVVAADPVVTINMFQQQQQEDLADHPSCPPSLICPICHEVFSQAIALSCGHTLCAACLASYANSTRRSGNATVPCPCCRQIIRGSIANLAVRQLVAELPQHFRQADDKQEELGAENELLKTENESLRSSLLQLQVLHQESQNEHGALELRSSEELSKVEEELKKVQEENQKLEEANQVLEILVQDQQQHDQTTALEQEESNLLREELLQSQELTRTLERKLKDLEHSLMQDEFNAQEATRAVYRANHVVEAGTTQLQRAKLQLCDCSDKTALPTAEASSSAAWSRAWVIGTRVVWIWNSLAALPTFLVEWQWNACNDNDSISSTQSPLNVIKEHVSKSLNVICSIWLLWISWEIFKHILWG